MTCGQGDEESMWISQTPAFVHPAPSKSQQNSENGVSAIVLDIDKDIGHEKPSEGDICPS